MSNGQGVLFEGVDMDEKLGVRNEKLVLKPLKIGPFTTNQVYQQDCIEGMKKIPDYSVDLAIADPPYNLSKGGNWGWDNSEKLAGFGGDWNKVMAEWDDMPLAEYVSFTLAWLRELQRVVRPTGSIWVHGTYHNAGILNFCMQLLQLEIINEVVWYKRNSFPNLSGRRMTASHETILWAHTGGKKRQYLFNYENAKEMECPEDGLKKAGKQLRTVWDIPNNKKKTELAYGKHPTQKPLRLLRRMLEVSANTDGIILVPFSGAGSECVAAQEFGMHFLGFELEEEYVEMGCKRLGIAGANSSKSVKTEKKELPPLKEKKSNDKAKNVPSLLKWTGSKRSQVAAITDLLPVYKKYYEPFVGSGAVLYVANRGNSVAGDLYDVLIDFWKLVQDSPSLLVKNYANQWKQLQKELDLLSGKHVEPRSGVPKYFYKVRKRFNKESNPLDLNFLMRTCVNGIVRFNGDGEFNNSFHLSRRGMLPSRFENIVSSWHSVLKGTTFLCQDYEATLAEAKEGDFVYLDPPYAGNHQRYIEDLDLERFFTVLDELNGRDVKWALSFDGQRGDIDLTHEVPSSLFKSHIYLSSGNSAVHKVLNGPIEKVQESLYLNY